MKYSGVEWIGEIPENWKLNKIGQLFNLRNEKVSDKDYSPLSVSKGGIVPQMENVAKSDASDDRKLVLKGDFAINSRSDRKMSCGVSPLDGSVSLINTILYPKNDDVIYNDYMNYLLKNYGFAEEFYRWGHGIVADLWTTKWQEMKSIMLPLPSVQKQKTTYDFLNQKNAEIDSLIEIENHQIEKLKEYKQAVISEIVTKGLDKNVPMKDSGVSWIGLVPESYNMMKMGWLANYKKGPFGSSLKISMFVPRGANTYKVYEQKNAIYKDETLGYYYISKDKFEELSSNEILPGDIIVSCAGTIGECFLMPDTMEPGIINQALMRVRLNEEIIPQYFLYLFDSVISKESQSSSNGSAMKNIPPFDVLKNIRVFIPSKDEQIKVVSILDKKSKEIDALIFIKQKKIDDLNEYKKSLIYEYVTGKKEVC